MSHIISAASMRAAATAYGAEQAARIDRAAFQAEFAALSINASALAADVGCVIADRARAATHGMTLQLRLNLAAARNAQPERC